MKKIAFVVAVPGTAHSFLLDHFEQLKKQFDIHLIANFPSEDTKTEFVLIGVTCHQVPILRKISLLNDLKALFELRKVLKKEKFDSVHSITPKAGLLSSIAGWLTGVPNRIHTFTGQVWATKKGIFRSVLKLMDKVIVNFDTQLLVDGESQRQFLIKEGVLRDDNSQVLANGSICGVRLERFVISDDVRRTERSKFHFKDNDVVFIFMGRLNHDKGIGELYTAFNRLVTECPNAKLVLYGTDEEGYDAKASFFSNIKRNENFFFPGHTKRPFDALQGGDVFVLPTWREGFGSSVIEAQALGLPVITSDAYGVVDASVPEETGLRCKVNDPNGLYGCMKIYYDAPALREKHGQAGRKRVEENFDYRVVTKAWSKFYKILLVN